MCRILLTYNKYKYTFMCAHTHINLCVYKYTYICTSLYRIIVHTYIYMMFETIDISSIRVVIINCARMINPYTFVSAYKCPHTININI